MLITHWILLQIINASLKIWRENQNTIYVALLFFRKSCLLWDSVEKYRIARRSQITIKHSEFALHAMYLRLQNALRILITFFLRQQLLHKYFWILRYMYIACVVPKVRGGGGGGDTTYFELHSITHSLHLTRCSLWMWT